MKQINDIPAVFTDAIETAISAGTPTGLDTLHFHFNFIENFNATYITKVISDDTVFAVIVEPPQQWPVSLRTSSGLDENTCKRTFELNIFVLKFQVKDSEFHKATSESLDGSSSFTKNYVTGYGDIDDCIEVLQKIFQAVYIDDPTAFQIMNMDGDVDVLQPGISSKEMAGINFKAEIQWY